MTMEVPKKLQLRFDNFFKGKEAVIIDPSSSTRATIKRVLSSIGFPIGNIHIVPDYFQAIEVIKDKMAAIIFTAADIGKEKTAEDLLELHLDLIPNRENCVFMVISKHNSEASAAAYLDTEVDNYICQPFNTETLQSSVMKAFKQKVTQTAYDREVCKIKSLIYTKEFDEAKQRAEKSLTMNKNQAWSYFLLGNIEEVQSNFQAAIDQYRKALDSDTSHYQTLSGLMRCYQSLKMYADAYDAATLLLDQYPLSINSIPDLIRISLANQKFEDLEKISAVLVQIPDLSPTIKLQISAGLALCGKHLLKNQNRELGVKSLKKALETCDFNPNIVLSVGQTYVDSALYKEAMNVLNQYDDKLGAMASFKVLELEVFYRTGEKKGHIISLGNQLLKKNIKQPKVYEIMLEASRELNRRPEAIEQIVFDATKDYPELKGHFQKYLG